MAAWRRCACSSDMAGLATWSRERRTEDILKSEVNVVRLCGDESRQCKLAGGLRALGGWVER